MSSEQVIQDLGNIYSEEVSSESSQAAVKIPAMIVMFIMTMVFGNIPLRMKAFKENKLVLALANGFAGGLFLAVGLLHLLPEAAENFENYYDDHDHDEDGEHDHNSKKHGGDDDEDEAFPWAFLITVLSFALILFIEKIAVPHEHGTGSHHGSPHGSPKNSHLKHEDKISLQTIEQNNNSHQKPLIFDAENLDQPLEDERDEQIATYLNTKQKLARSFQKEEIRKSFHESDKVDLTPYILQIAIGIHAVFEGIAIGIQQSWSQALGVALAVIGHKWAEALTLGISFRNANVELNKATIMIAIQAVMNPVGVGIGWIISNQGQLLTGIFTSISVGTFVYIATMEVIVEEFAKERYKWQKFLIFLAAIGFVCMLWWFEQLSGE